MTLYTFVFGPQRAKRFDILTVVGTCVQNREAVYLVNIKAGIVCGILAGQQGGDVPLTSIVVGACQDVVGVGSRVPRLVQGYQGCTPCAVSPQGAGAAVQAGVKGVAPSRA